ncbi:hypothetical protein [Geobacter sp. 60473]|uniref:hypothetical protein n=1 Tax=Geobacter sp. 60473 TaxID=3080755 RepID=UPI002B300B4C|nr:hypothetical protein GEO60473_21900 [Geobacter sp. 60473]
MQITPRIHAINIPFTVPTPSGTINRSVNVLNGTMYYFESSLSWATIDLANIWGWNAARNYFHDALIFADPSDKELYNNKLYFNNVVAQ